MTTKPPDNNNNNNNDIDKHGYSISKQTNSYHNAKESSTDRNDSAESESELESQSISIGFCISIGSGLNRLYLTSLPCLYS